MLVRLKMLGDELVLMVQIIVRVSFVKSLWTVLKRNCVDGGGLLVVVAVIGFLGMLLVGKWFGGG